MTVFCKEHQTLFLDVKVFVGISWYKPFALLHVPFKCEELNRKHKNFKGERGKTEQKIQMSDEI